METRWSWYQLWMGRKNRWEEKVLHFYEQWPLLWFYWGAFWKNWGSHDEFLTILSVRINIEKSQICSQQKNSTPARRALIIHSKLIWFLKLKYLWSTVWIISERRKGICNIRRILSFGDLWGEKVGWIERKKNKRIHVRMELIWGLYWI